VTVSSMKQVRLDPSTFSFRGFIIFIEVCRFSRSLVKGKLKVDGAVGDVISRSF
jgi:hypothetical protein